MQTKKCTGCQKELPATPEYFYRSGIRNEKLQLKCKCIDCCKAENKVNGYKRQKKYRQNHPDRVIADRIQYKKKNKDKIKEYSRKRYLEKREHILKTCKTYRMNNPDKRRETKKKYIIKNIKKVRAQKCINEQRRRAKQNKALNTLTKSDWEMCLNNFNYSCAYCGKVDSDLQQDHVIPLSKGGAYVSRNIVPACISCNARKNSHDLEKWYKQQKFFSKRRWNKICKWINYDEELKIQQLALC